MKIIGLDVGTKRIGVSKADTGTKIAVPETYLNVNGQEFSEIARIGRLYDTTLFVVGLPRNNSGKETKQSTYARNFARTLAMSVPNSKIYFQDESLTSVEAEARLKNRKRKYEKGEIDAEAATVILQDFLERMSASLNAGQSVKADITSETAPALAPADGKQDKNTKNAEQIAAEVQQAASSYAASPAGLQQYNQEKPVKKHKALKTIGIFLLVLVLLGGVGFGAAYFWYTENLKSVYATACTFESAEAEAADEKTDDKPGCKFEKFTVTENSTVADIAAGLKSAGLIKSDIAFQIYVKLQGVGNALKAGEYEFRSVLSVQDIVDKLLKGAAATNVFNFTVLPGETVADVKARLVNDYNYDAEVVEAAFKKHYNSPVLDGLYHPDGSLADNDQPESVQLEGYLYGETYQFYIGENVEKIVETAISELNEVVIGNKLKEKFAAQNLTLRQGIILASIVQKEARGEDMPGVAMVFLNRLRLGMSLGSDVTAKYAADLFDPERQTLISNADVLAFDSRYNTRMHTGLTPGPISSPGISALNAVANPDESHSEDIYFLTGDDGKMYYSSTDEGHQRNIRDYCREMCQVAL